MTSRGTPFALIVFVLSFTWLLRQPTATDEERLAALQARVDVAQLRAEYEVQKREERARKREQQREAASHEDSEGS